MYRLRAALYAIETWESALTGFSFTLLSATDSCSKLSGHKSLRNSNSARRSFSESCAY